MKNLKFIHPAIIAVYPLLNLVSLNLQVVLWQEVIAISAVLILSAYLVFALCRLVSRNNNVALLTTTALIIFFYTFQSLKKEASAYEAFVPAYFLGSLLVIGVLLSVGFYFKKLKLNLILALTFSGLLSVLLLLTVGLLPAVPLLLWLPVIYAVYKINFLAHVNNYVALISIFLLVFASYNTFEKYQPFYPEPKVVSINISEENLPDIYYIIVDGYGRADVLDEFYGYDNSVFLNYLEEKGFFVGENSVSNYGQTVFSLASTLNMRFMPLKTYLYRNEISQKDIKNNKVFSILRSAGYEITAQPSGYAFTEMNYADNYNNSYLLGDFFNAFIRHTPAEKWLKGFQYKVHRNRLVNNLRILPELGNKEKPTFVFTHLLAPHPPFVLGWPDHVANKVRPFSLADGNHFHFTDSLTQVLYKELFKLQTDSLNQLLMATIDNILATSQNPPVIILQADHGPGCYLHHDNFELTNVKERYSILNAFYFPDKDYSMLYESISTVNTFPVVFNKFLGSEYQLLPDSKFWSNMEFVHLVEINVEEEELLAEEIDISTDNTPEL